MKKSNRAKLIGKYPLPLGGTLDAYWETDAKGNWHLFCEWERTPPPKADLDHYKKVIIPQLNRDIAKLRGQKVAWIVV